MVDRVSGQAERVRVMWPFYGCVSLGPVMNGRCGNCCWTEKGCDWERLEDSSDPADPYLLAAIRKPFDVSKPAREVQLARWKKGKPLRCDLDQEVRAQEEGRNPARPSKNKKRGRK